MIFDSHEISYNTLYFFRKLGKMPQNLSSPAVVIDPLRAKYWTNIAIRIQSRVVIGPTAKRHPNGVLLVS